MPVDAIGGHLGRRSATGSAARTPTEDWIPARAGTTSEGGYRVKSPPAYQLAKAAFTITSTSSICWRSGPMR